MRDMKVLAVWVASLVTLALLATGVPAHAATFTDMLGRPVAVPEGSLRLVSLAPSLTEIVFALDRGDWLAGVTEFCDYPPAARSKPRVGGPVTPDLERILQLRPSLVLITAEGNPLQTVGRLAQLGLSVFAVRPESYAGILASIQMLGRVLQAEPEAAGLVRNIQGRAAAVRLAVRARPRPRVLYLVWSDPLVAAGPASFVGDLLEMAGAENIVLDRTVPYPRLGWEEVVGRAPDVILMAEHRDQDGPPIGRGELRTTLPLAGWRSVPAVRSGRVLVLPGDKIHRPGPRVIEGLEELARAIHPEAFARREWR